MRPEDGKRIYDGIEIPEELGDVVNRAIASKKKEDIMKESQKEFRKRGQIRCFRSIGAVAAALLVCLTVGLNTSEAFAREMQGLPVLGALAKVLTIRSYHGTQGDYEIDMEVPEIELESDAQVTPEAEAVKVDVNAEIQKIVDDYMAQAKAEFEAYKEAFFETGGTEEEWANRTMDIYVDYDVKYQKDNLLSLELITAKGWVSSQEERYYYNLNLADGSQLTLQELLGEDYIDLVNQSVIDQIQERIAADENMMYFGYGPDEDGIIEGFTTITPDTKFYINENGNVVIVFEKYEIAPGYMGFQEFEIPAQQ